MKEGIKWADRQGIRRDWEVITTIYQGDELNEDVCGIDIMKSKRYCLPRG